MKSVLKLEELALFGIFTLAYFYLYPGAWVFFLILFFVPDVSFVFYLISTKVGAIAYNTLHHKGIMALVVFLGFVMQNEWMIKIGLIFLAHSSFDRVFGYGLKYNDSFERTHLGWIGKSKLANRGE